MDIPEIWPEPLPIVVDCLRTFDGWQQVEANLPDIHVTKKRGDGNQTC